MLMNYKTIICLASIGIAVIAVGVYVKNNKKEAAPPPVEEPVKIDSTGTDSTEVVGKL